jgi:hypothetical protein
MNQPESYQELLEFKNSVLSATQHEDYTIILGFILFILGINAILNVILFFINKSNEEEINHLNSNLKPNSFLDIITTPQPGQQVCDDYFNNADLPKK